MNTPGPFYTGDSDFALVGPHIAPDFVACDDERIDIVFRQPATSSDLGEVLSAARSDAFDGYACDGNEHWTVAGVREWWRRVPEIRQHIADHLFKPSWWRYASEVPLVLGIGEAWQQFLDTGATAYLRDYCYFLDNGSWPEAEHVRPDL